MSPAQRADAHREPLLAAALRSSTIAAPLAASPGFVYLLTLVQSEEPISTNRLLLALAITVLPLVGAVVGVGGTVAAGRRETTPCDSPRNREGEPLMSEAYALARAAELIPPLEPEPEPEPQPVRRPEPEYRAPLLTVEAVQGRMAKEAREAAHAARGPVGESWPNASREPGRPVRTPRRDDDGYGAWTGRDAERDDRARFGPIVDRGSPGRGPYNGDDWG